jgi:hypothetical protein
MMEKKRWPFREKNKLNGLVVEGCLDKQMIIIVCRYKLFHNARFCDNAAKEHKKTQWISPKRPNVECLDENVAKKQSARKEEGSERNRLGVTAS